MSARVPALLTVYAGTFPSQPMAFAALLDAANALGLEADLADIDVIREAREVRLAHYFRPAVAARIAAASGSDDTLIVARPSAITADPAFPPEGARVRLIGRFAGEVIEA